MHLTPHFTGPQPPSAGLTCGTNLPSLEAPCGEPATWHVLWASDPDDTGTIPAGLLCDPHMDQTARHHAWYERHPAGPACASPALAWHGTHCAEGDTA